MPTENDTRVRVDGLSNRTATAPGPASGWGAGRAGLPLFAQAGPVGLHLVGQVEHLDQLVGRQVVVAQEVPGHGASSPPGRAAATVAASRTPGRAMMNESACVSGRRSGGPSRTTSGPTALTRNPCSRAAVSTSAATGAVSTMPSIRP